MIRIPQSITAALVLSTALSNGQTPAVNEPVAASAPPVAPVAIEPEGKTWSVSLAAYTYIVPDDREYVQPTIMLDRDWLHLEARYNYENLDTGSLWAGYNFAGGDKLAWEITPMIGGVFGETTGIAPGYKGSLGWWKLELYTEGEVVFDTNESADSFFYSWSELTLAPWDWFRFGLVAQRTRLYESDREVQGGFLVGFAFERFDIAVYVLNPDEGEPTWVVSLGLSF